MDVIIIGGGIAGLVCARRLCESGLQCRLFEASDEIGGRVRTDHVDGFLLDRGFQVFLTAYPEAQRLLDMPRLGLRRFEPGALIHWNGKFHRLSDPWRRPQHLLATALSPVATLADKLRIARFRRQTTDARLSDLYQRPEQTTTARLREFGFSDVIIERFLRPFLGGVFLDRELQTSSRMCEFVFRMFSLGDATLPEKGMGQISVQLASHLPEGVIQTKSPVESLEGQQVMLASGERHTARAVVVATTEPTARRLLGEPTPAPGKSVRCLYFAAPTPPIREPILVLNGDGVGPVNNLCVPSQLSRSYAPDGQSLISVTVLKQHPDQAALAGSVRDQLQNWFGASVAGWRHLKTYDIPYALPSQPPPALDPVAKPPGARQGIFLCGDYCDTASINGAMASGLRAAQAVISVLNGNESPGT